MKNLNLDHQYYKTHQLQVLEGLHFWNYQLEQQQTKKLKLSKSEKSFVWKYFKKIDDGKVQCIIPIVKNEKEEPCNIIYKYNSFTSNMKYHLNVVHK